MAFCSSPVLRRRDGLTVLSGPSGSGRSCSLMAAMELERLVHRRLVLVCPAGVPRRYPQGVEIIAGAAARSRDVFALLSVLMETGGRDIVVGIDDAEHLPDTRRMWTGLLSMACTTGSSIYIVVPDLSSGKEWKSGSVVRFGTMSFPAMPFDSSMVALSDGRWWKTDLVEA